METLTEEDVHRIIEMALAMQTALCAQKAQEKRWSLLVEGMSRACRHKAILGTQVAADDLDQANDGSLIDQLLECAIGNVKDIALAGLEHREGLEDILDNATLQRFPFRAEACQDIDLRIPPHHESSLDGLAFHILPDFEVGEKAG